MGFSAVCLPICFKAVSVQGCTHSVPQKSHVGYKKPSIQRSYLDYCIDGVLVYPELLIIDSFVISSIPGIIHDISWKTQFDLLIYEENKTNQVVA